MCHNSCKRQDHTVRLRSSKAARRLRELWVSQKQPLTALSDKAYYELMMNLLSTYYDAQLAILGDRQALQSSTEKYIAEHLVHPGRGSKILPGGG